MPGGDRTTDGRHSGRTRPADGVPGLPRRSLLRGAAGAGVAGALIGVAATPALAGSIASTAGPGGARSAAVAGQPADAAPGERPGAAPIVVYLRDAGAGELDIFHGTSHTRLRDPDLARRLAAGIGR